MSRDRSGAGKWVSNLWTPETLQLAQSLYVEAKLSATSIVRQIPGLTIGAINGMVRRHQWQMLRDGLTPTIKAPRAPATRTRRRAIKIAGNGAIFHACETGPGPTDLPTHDGGFRICDPGFTGCRWPIGGTGADARFCCQPKDEGSPYCPDHHARGVQKTGTAKELARSVRRYAR